jgi:hypothetical protein
MNLSIFVDKLRRKTTGITTSLFQIVRMAFVAFYTANNLNQLFIVWTAFFGIFGKLYFFHCSNDDDDDKDMFEFSHLYLLLYFTLLVLSPVFLLRHGYWRKISFDCRFRCSSSHRIYRRSKKGGRGMQENRALCDAQQTIIII